MRVREKLETFWNAGIRGADFFISAIGPAVEVFGQYAEVRRPGGRPVEVGQLLEEVRTIVADYALQRLGEGIGQTDESTRFYVLFRWAYGNLELDFDEVNNLCKALGVELDDLVQAGLAWKKGGKARLYTVTERWHDASEAHALIHRFADEAQKKMPLIDALHGALALWRMGDTQGLQELLTVSGQMESELFWRTAQALFHVEDDWLGQQSLGQQQIGEDEDGETETEAANKAASGVSALREEHKLLQQFLKSPATLKSKVAEQIVLELER
jgi:adenine-specific DNA methylase